MSTVADVLNSKGVEVFGVKPGATVFEAIANMVEHNVGALVVMDEDVPVGMITERDYLRRVALEGRTSKATRVEEIMTPQVVCVEPHHSLEECMGIMTERRVRHLPVIKEGKLAGIISIGDVVKRLTSEQRAEIRYLHEYIQGGYPG